MAVNKFMFDRQANSWNNILLTISLFWLPFLAWMGFIFYTSSFKGAQIPCIFPLQDIVFHFFVYTVLGALFSRVLRKKTLLNWKGVVLFSLLFCFLYGLSDEFHQSFVPGRNASWIDVLVDTLGGLTGGLIIQWQK